MDLLLANFVLPLLVLLPSFLFPFLSVLFSFLSLCAPSIQSSGAFSFASGVAAKSMSGNMPPIIQVTRDVVAVLGLPSWSSASWVWFLTVGRALEKSKEFIIEFR